MVSPGKQVVLGWVAACLSFVVYISVLASGSAHGICLVATVVCACAFSIGLSVETLTKPSSPGTGGLLFSEPDPLQNPRLFAAARALIIFSLVTGTFLGPYTLLNTNLVIANSVLFVLFLLGGLSAALRFATKRRVLASYVPQERGISFFKPGDRVRQYREFVYSTLFFSCLPCVTAYGFVAPSSTSDAYDAEYVYEVKRIDPVRGRVLLAREEDGRPTDQGVWYSAPAAYKRCFPDSSGVEYFFDCYRPVDSEYQPPVRAGQSAAREILGSSSNLAPPSPAPSFRCLILAAPPLLDRHFPRRPGEQSLQRIVKE